MIKKLLPAAAALLLITMLLSGCAVTDAVCSILGIDAKDYSEEEKIADIEPDSETAATLLGIADILTCAGKNILTFDKMKDDIDGCYEATLNYLGSRYYGKYCADSAMFDKLAAEYPEYEVNTLIPEADFENAVYRFFGGKHKVSHRSVGFYVYLDKIDAYLYMAKTKSAVIRSELLSAYETENTYHADIRFYTDDETPTVCHIIWMKRDDADPYLYKVIKNTAVTV